MDENLTVSLRNGCKSYGRNAVLKNFNITVEKGAIYGLLGASGCGKTTLLNCIVGTKSLDSGELWVLGGKPGSKGSGVPGAKVGFMPQDTGLVGELTVKDTIYYFGKLMKMSDNLIAERYETLSDIMDLPPSSRFVKNCSGGQQRRVSFAASMVHLPELLILDEPTVGVDPVLRARIWEYLLDVTKLENMTVIITTHYIEEARQANMVGMMRDGMLLVQDSPDNLLEKFEKENLEEVFFILSLKQEKGCLTQTSNINESDRAIGDQEQKRDVQIKEKKVSKALSVSGKRMHALLNKNWKQFRNNLGVTLFLMLFPVLQMSTFLAAIGKHVHNIDIAIVNYDSCDSFTMNETAIDKTTSYMSYSTKTCEFKTLSCRFLTYVDDPMFNMIAYDDLEAAFEDGRKGKVKGIIHMTKNFTESYQYRFDMKLGFSDLMGSPSDDLVAERAINLDHGQIKVWLDMSYPQIGYGVKGRLLTRFDDFQKDLLGDCHIEPQVGRIVDIQTINGLVSDDYTSYMVPGVILTIIFYTTTLLTLSTIVTERTEGIWDRAIIAGVSSMEIILSHFLLQICVVILYVIELFCFTFLIFKIESIGSIWIIALSAFLLGVAGLCFGFLISILCSKFSVALMVTGGFFIIMICICGFMWPIEAMPIGLQWFSKCLPFTIPINSFRDVMRRGWGFQDPNIITGFVIEISWILALVIMDVVALKFKR